MKQNKNQKKLIQSDNFTTKNFCLQNLNTFKKLIQSDICRTILQQKISVKKLIQSDLCQTILQQKISVCKI
ncbi:MAG: hypothetical protein EAZ97_07020 [Bacteroidetes bacterium]|nr:MAG: hypothetical protein EAZ97_07020 [Bacteroidota bacterium]